MPERPKQCSGSPAATSSALRRTSQTGVRTDPARRVATRCSRRCSRAIAGMPTPSSDSWGTTHGSGGAWAADGPVRSAGRRGGRGYGAGGRGRGRPRAGAGARAVGGEGVVGRGVGGGGALALDAAAVVAGEGDHVVGHLR